MIVALNGDFRRGTLEVKLPMGATMGRSDNGCTADAERALYGDLKTWFEAKQITANLTELRRMRVLNDPRYLARTRMVLGCMRKHGHTYDGLDKARAAFLGTHASNDRAAEISAAVTEAKCATSTGFSAFADRLDREYGEEISRKYRSVYATRFRLEHKALARARSALKYSGAYYCLPRGHYLMDMSLDHFSRGSGRAGYGDVMNDNVVSSKWTTEC